MPGLTTCAKNPRNLHGTPSRREATHSCGGTSKLFSSRRGFDSAYGWIEFRLLCMYLCCPDAQA